MDTLKILAADDEARTRKLVKDFLTNRGFAVIGTGGGEEAVDVSFAQRDTALMSLGVIISKMDGWEILKTTHEYSQVPIIMLAVKNEGEDEFQGFSLGVDEYISRPFSLKILMIWVEVIFGRVNVTSADSVDVGGIYVDKMTHQVTVDGQRIDLSSKEFELLIYFMENQGVALSREKILNNVWDCDYLGDARIINTHVKKLRSRMGGKGGYIKII